MEQEKQDVSSLLLLGTEEATMDDKGRVLVGTKLRKRLGANFVMTLGANGSIHAFPLREWNVLAGDLISRDPRQKSRQDYARYLFGNAADELDFDTQGRVVIPKKLRELAEIEDKVVIVGMGDYLEIWNKTVYSHAQKHAPGQQDSLEQMLAEPRFKPGQAVNAIQLSVEPGGLN